MNNFQNANNLFLVCFGPKVTASAYQYLKSWGNEYMGYGCDYILTGSSVMIVCGAVWGSYL